MIACVLLRGAVCAAFYALGYAAFRYRLIPQHAETADWKFACNGSEYYAMPACAFIFAAIEAAFWFPFIWWGETRGILLYKIRSYGQENDVVDEQDDESDA